MHTATGGAHLGNMQVRLGSLDTPWLQVEKRNSYVLQLLLDVFVIQLFVVLLNYIEDWVDRKCLPGPTCHSCNVNIKLIEDLFTLAGVSTFHHESTKRHLRYCKMKPESLPGDKSHAILWQVPHYRSSLKGRLPPVWLWQGPRRPRFPLPLDVAHTFQVLQQQHLLLFLAGLGGQPASESHPSIISACLPTLDRCPSTPISSDRQSSSLGIFISLSF